MKIAIVGKGGTGKTTVAGTMIRDLARRGRRVTAIDADPNPTLAMTLGVDPALAETAPVLPPGLLETVRLPDGSAGYRLRRDVQEIIDGVGLEGPDGVTLVVAGRVEHAARGCMCGTHAAVRTILGAIADAATDVVMVDMEAGIEHFSRAAGTLKYADALLVLVEPFYKSLVTARSIVGLSAELGIPQRFLVANKVRNEADLTPVEQVSAETGLELIGVIPFDPRLQEAEAAGVAPLDFDPQAPGVRAIVDLVDAVLGRLATATPRASSAEVLA